jgi:ubiquinone/menaquinone biosynthesis C-methylase UbiE
VPRVAAENEEALEAWDGVLFDRFLQFRDIVTDGLGAHGEAALAAHPPREGERVLDIGCGFGDTSRRIAGIVGEAGSVLGVDVAPRFIELAQQEAASAGLENVAFDVRDVQVTTFEDRFDYAFARFGTMFFASPVAAMRNVREAMAPGGRLCMVVWRRKLDNDWLHRAEKVVDEYLEEPEETDEPTCGPGPFSMSNADTTSDILQGAGFVEVELRRCDIPIKIGRDLDHAVAFATAIGPAGEVIRLAGDEAAQIRPTIEASLREALAEFVGPDGVIADASTWIVSARAPQAASA